ncbi:Hexokinase-2 [Fragariocoptes setiger]|uniref:Phosphotransferase n=1 Tax=Fragariocoptes setiger TaxID=1670756 RepID=A0ABQ7S6T6_9ACAR|nr:Hexokinase-2 [Fragariocoptes setiger]
MERVEALTQQLILSDQQLQRICNILIHEFNRGLHRETNPEANVKMYPTYVKNVCDKYRKEQNSTIPCQFSDPEEGKFLALDLGGTNFRVVLVELEGANSEFHMDSETFAVPQHIMLGTGEQLFDHIADCLSQFIDKRAQLQGHRLPLGFTFSFPCRQEGLRRAKLISWTKGFKCSGVEGRDVVELLRGALRRRPDIDIEVMAVVNDTTGTLMSCAFNNRDCRVGLIVGTGTNACYLETMDQVHLAQRANNAHSTSTAADISSSNENDNGSVDNERDHDDEQLVDDAIHGSIPAHAQQIVVNTEWGAFGDNGCLDFVRTTWDDQIDCESVNIGKQRFEKMISGMYIGELVRLILADLALNRKLLFTDSLCLTSSQLHDILSLSDNDSSSSGIDSGSDDDHNSPTTTNNNQQTKHQEFIKRLLTPYNFNTKYVSLIESDAPEQFGKTRHALMEAFGCDWASEYDCRVVQLVCARISTRAAHLVSAAVAALLNKMHRPYTTVGVDGSVFRYHPHFHRLMQHKTKELTNPECAFELKFSEDGSGRGAALVAAVACKQRRISRDLITRGHQIATTVEC